MLKFIFNIILIIKLFPIKFKSNKIDLNSTNSNFLNLYIITHKDFNNYITNPNYKILCDDYYQLKNNYTLNVINTKNNNELFEKRIGYSEGSKIYYIWKQYKNNLIKSKYVGFNHYRRIFNFGNNIPNLDKIFKKYDIILNRRFRSKLSLKKQYYKSHNEKDLNEILNIIKKKFPKYYSIALKTIKSKKFYICNIFIMKSEDFIEYGNFVFTILNEFDKKNNLISDENIKDYVLKNKKKKKRKKFKIEYQRRLQGFLLERISNIFYNYHFKKKYQIKTKSIFNNNTKLKEKDI